MPVALVLRAGTHKELRTHSLFLLHGTLAVVVIIQDQAIQFLSWVVAHRIKGDVVIFLPPCKEEAQKILNCH